LHSGDHSRDIAGLTYVYPVVSRRAGGVSVGINLNPNNACNWRCVYCQVPDLKRGSAPLIDLVTLEAELRTFLHEIVHGDFMQTNVNFESRRINDIALSGNGEPTSSPEFAEVINLIGRVKADYELPNSLKLILITNGSLIARPEVQAGLRAMAQISGEIWFKLDSVTREGRQRINNTRMSLMRMGENLRLATILCPTWLQTCVFQADGVAPAVAESDAYLSFLEGFLNKGGKLKGVLLYGLARPSMQPEAPRLTKVDQVWMEAFSARIRALGVDVRLNP
jgi:wyosine [tRNA(Phe)-imidazoG37] synthetase (radical SAM superfamily)